MRYGLASEHNSQIISSQIIGRNKINMKSISIEFHGSYHIVLAQERHAKLFERSQHPEIRSTLGMHPL